MSGLISFKFHNSSVISYFSNDLMFAVVLDSILNTFELSVFIETRLLQNKQLACDCQVLRKTKFQNF